MELTADAVEFSATSSTVSSNGKVR
jgi:hypothetical protein